MLNFLARVFKAKALFVFRKKNIWMFKHKSERYSRQYPPIKQFLSFLKTLLIFQPVLAYWRLADWYTYSLYKDYMYRL